MSVDIRVPRSIGKFGSGSVHRVCLRNGMIDRLEWLEAGRSCWGTVRGLWHMSGGVAWDIPWPDLHQIFPKSLQFATKWCTNVCPTAVDPVRGAS